MSELEAKKIERMGKVYEHEKTLRATALEEALAARNLGKRVPPGRHYRDPGTWRSLHRFFSRGVKPWWMP